MASCSFLACKKLHNEQRIMRQTLVFVLRGCRPPSVSCRSQEKNSLYHRNDTNVALDQSQIHSICCLLSGKSICRAPTRSQTLMQMTNAVDNFCFCVTFIEALKCFGITPRLSYIARCAHHEYFSE